ncbi:receptor-type tyrosine-protein phosphatase epsilon-like isoform X2 [Haliotis rubra]|uniref:receptor-type tyrosine-protein phosphatase epsilon-like isoform X2 n=1 Tax=Haliotis rubra TaxID=36100 RepID=UPI001EE55721|nr:receptor-type tyrosine-protein phosphatase epsilon-like isoform X2 [Haliotis rubra]
MMNGWYSLFIFPIVVIVCLDQHLPPHTVNVALNMTATQHGEFNDTHWCNKDLGQVCGNKPANLAVDGNTERNFWSGSCAHPDEVSTPWWQVDLGQMYNISWIRIYTRAQSEVYMDSTIVTVGNTNCYKHIPGTDVAPVMNIRCDNVTKGQTVNISLASGEKMSLCEVQVLMCEDHWFGVNCTNQCHCVNNATCDKTTGYCNSGCVAGFTGNDCLTECDDYTFGSNCAEKCHCKGNTTCNKTTGFCQGGCAPGWTKADCQTECSNNTFGLNCRQKCHCLNNTTCNKTSGYCQSGCAAGWKRGNCQTECPDFTFGYKCSHQCHCQNNATCNKTTGYCQRGCAAGWKGDACQTECTNNTFGVNCSQRCHCKDNVMCDKTSGICQGGCAPGWMEHNCQTECNNYTFGVNCSEQCHCQDNDTCNKTTGYCQSGCEAGWKGDDCQTACSNSTYGTKCKKTCHCKTSGVCEKTTGHCEGGCADGWTGESCHEPESALNIAVIGGGVGGAIVILVVIAGVIIYRKRNRSSEDNISDKREDDAVPMSETRAKSQADPHEDDHGPVYSNVRSRSVRVTELQQYIRERYGMKNGFMNEYNMFPSGNQHPCDISKGSGNKGKNRFIGIYPYDHSRVLLKKLPGKDHSDYINANYLHGYSRKNAYIATQGPNSVTLPDFWRMMYEHNIKQIVMLTNVYETAKKKCEEYWPEAGERKQFGNILVVNNGETARADWVIRNMQLKDKKTGEIKTVTQYHFVTWPDHGVPSAPAITAFWKKVCDDGRSNDLPMVVHCSAGIGRTGTFIGLDFLFDQARTEGRVDFFQCIQQMRDNRINMIQTAEQYRFLHEAVFEATQSDSSFYTVDTFERTFQTFESADKENELIIKEMNSLIELQRTPGEKEITAATLPANGSKNRSQAIIPADRHRVMLSSEAPGTNDYINALSLPFFANKGEFLVTQMPLKKTVVDFWRMVVERGCNLIVALDTPDSVSSEQDVGVYLPKGNEPVTCSPFIVLHDGVNTPCEGVTETFLTVKRESIYANEDITSVSLLMFNDWPRSQEIPTNKLSVIRFINTIDQRMMKSPKKPVVVHCFDGATRSGLICSLINIMSRLKLDKEIDIHLSVRELKQHRHQFIPSSAQLRFCFEIVQAYLNTNRISRHQ